MAAVLWPSPSEAATSVSLKPGSTNTAALDSTARTNVTAQAVVSIAKIPTSGSGVYTSVEARSGTRGAYVAQVRTYAGGKTTLVIKRANGTGASRTLTTLGSTVVLANKATAGAKITVSITLSGTSSVTITAKAKVGSGSTKTSAATDKSSSRISSAGTTKLTLYTAKSSPAVKVTRHSSKVTSPTTSTSSSAQSTTPTTSASSYPSAATTGVPAGTKLTVHNGDLIVTKNNTVINGLEVRGTIDIRATGVVIKNSRIVGGTTVSSVGLVSNVRSGLAFTIMDSEIYASKEDPGWNGIVGSNFTAERVNVHNVVDPIRVFGDNVTVRDSWLHDNSHWEKDSLRGGTPTHDDSVQIEGGKNILLEGNRFEDADNAAVQITQNTSVATLGAITIRGNYLDGGGCTVNIADSAKKIKPTITGNAFGPNRKYASCAVIAPVAPTLSGNTWAATGKTMSSWTST